MPDPLLFSAVRSPPSLRAPFRRHIAADKDLNNRPPTALGNLFERPAELFQHVHFFGVRAGFAGPFAALVAWFSWAPRHPVVPSSPAKPRPPPTSI